MRISRIRAILIVLMAIGIMSSVANIQAARACPFCGASGTTLTQDAGQSALILFGTLENAKFNPDAPNAGTTDLQIELIVKDHPFIGGKKTVTLNRYIQLDKNTPVKYLVFCDVFNNKLDAYRGLPVNPKSPIATYLKGALELREKDVTSRLTYFFKFLDSDDIDVSNDAYVEFANADYKDFRPLAEKLPPDELAKWLDDPNTPASRFGLYGSMLGHCGAAKHAVTLRHMLDDPKKRFGTGIDGMIAGYVMLLPKEGWGYVLDLVKDPGRDFLVRYAALRAIRFFWEYRSDIVAPSELINGVMSMVGQDDISDLAIEDLRKWKRWEVTEKIIGLYGRKSHDVPIIRRAILRFALCAQADNEKAREFVKAMRAKDKSWVEDVEDLLRFENEPPKPANTTPTIKTPKTK
jgi:hypothetical protein